MEKNREYDQVKTAFVSLFYVFVLSEIAGSVGTMIDSIIVGKLLEPSALAALSLGRPCFAISKAVAAVLASGGMFRYSTYIGRSELAKAKQVFPLCLNVCVMGGILFTFIMLAFIPEISWTQGVTTDMPLYPEARGYLIGSSVGMVPYMLTCVFMAMLKINGGKRPILLATLIMTITNVILDLVTVLVFDAGMLGIGLATSISYVVAGVYCVLALQGKMEVCRFMRLNRAFWQECRSIMTYGGSAGFFRLYMALGMGLVNRILIAAGGIGAVAVYSLWMTILGFVGVVGLAVGLSLATLSALFAGEEDKKGILWLLRYAVRFGVLVTMAESVLVFVGAEHIAGVFGIYAGSEYADMAVTAIRCFALFLLPNLFVMISTNYYSSIGNVVFPNMMWAGDKLFVLIPVVSLLSYWGMTGIWFGMAVTEVIVLMLPIVYIWFRDRRFPSLERLLFFHKTIGVPENMEIITTIPNDLQAVFGLVPVITKFMVTHQVSHRCAMFTALSLEEMLCNIVKFAYPQGGKHFIDVRVLLKGKDLIVCIRNDGVEFNSIKFYERHKNDDPCANIGIRIIMKLAKDVKYHYLVGMNQLVIFCDATAEYASGTYTK